MFFLSKIRAAFSQLSYKIILKEVKNQSLPLVVSFINSNNKVEFIRFETNTKENSSLLPKSKSIIWIATPHESFIYKHNPGANSLIIEEGQEKIEVSQE